MDFSDRLEELKQADLKYILTNNWAIGAVSVIFLLALYLRLMPAQGMKYLQALDPYMILRMSRHLALDGNLPVSDFMRYFPYNTPTYYMNLGNITIPAVLYWLGPFAFFGSYMTYAQFYPALMGAFCVIVMYFLGKETFDRLTGLSAAFFLATIAGVMHRTSAGFFEKEPTGTLLMLFSLYFFTRSWKREEWISGILSGIALGLFSISWGGSKMLWLLYPMVVGIMLWLNEDIRNLITVYTPTVLVGAGIAAALNWSRFWITDTWALVNFAMLGLLWSRYLAEEWNIIEEDKLGYYIPSISFLGLILMALSPLYSNFVARKVIGLLNMVPGVSSGGGGAIGGTVAENTPASLSQLASQLGALNAGRIGFFVTELRPASSLLAGLAQINGTWPLAFIGTVLLGTTVAAMVFRKYNMLEKTIEGRTYHKIVVVALLGWTMVFSVMFDDPVLIAVGPSIFAILGSLGILHGLDEFKPHEIEFKWYYLLPLAWGITNILGAVTKSRLVFLAAFSVALMAGYAFSVVLKKLNSMNIESLQYLGIVGGVLIADIALVAVLLTFGAQMLMAAAAVVALNGIGLYVLQDRELSEITKDIDDQYIRYGVIGIVVVATVSVNLASGFVAANQLGGSPNNLWMDNLEHMEDETPEDSVILSWWDYGYWFETIGDRAAVADGGNYGYYTSDGGEKINYPLAEFLTGSGFENHTEFLNKHSVDYIVLDETMIGKYSAVSQIAHRSNSEYNYMMQASTSRNIQNSIGEQGNRTLVQFRNRRSGITTYASIEQDSQDGSTSISSAPVLETRSGSRGEIGCVLTENGVKEFNVSQPMNLGQNFGEICAAVNPYYSIDSALYSAENPQIRSRQAKIVLVPRKIADSNLVRLYLMDGYGVNSVEKVEDGSNGYVKMWEVTEN
jgi:asparagine N-glycosylation enzyme membrane subunit Stt3